MQCARLCQRMETLDEDVVSSRQEAWAVEGEVHVAHTLQQATPPATHTSKCDAVTLGASHLAVRFPEIPNWK